MGALNIEQQRAIALASARLRLQQEPQSEDALQAPSMGERAQAGIGGTNKGISGLLGLPVDTASNLINLGIAGVGSATGTTPELIKNPVLGSDWIAQKMQGLGINTSNPRPDDPASRMLHTGGMILGGSMLPGAGVKGAMGAAAGGALAGETLGPEWTGVGAMAPGAASQAIGGIRNTLAAKAAPIVETFQQAGTMPSVGQATDNVFLHGIENLASKFPGGAGVMQRFIEGQQASMGAKARTGVATDVAGRAIEKGISGEGGFLARTKETWNRLDNAVASKIPKGSAFAPSNTVQALDDLTRPVPGAERSTGAPLDARITAIKTNLMEDLQANNGQMPFEALRAIRSRVGAQIDDALVQGSKSGEMSKLYGALSKDLEAAATQAGAGKEFARQNKFYRARMDRIESVLERVIGKGKQPEDIFKSVMPTEPDQANKLRAVMRSLSVSERQLVSEAVANRMGRAKPGAQDVEGNVFSSETFLTNWTKLSKGAKEQLFPDPPLRENMDRLSKAAGEIRSGKGVYANPSGTAGSFAAYAVYMGPIAAIGGGLAGVPGAVAASATTAGSAYIGARMLTSPKIVKWLATPVNPTRPGEMQAHLARLAIIYNSTNDPEVKQDLSKFIGSIDQGASQ